jgi:hypothetical protein
MILFALILSFALLLALLLSPSLRYKLRIGVRHAAFNVAMTLPLSEHALSLLPTAAHVSNLLTKVGADGDHYAVIAATSDEPLGLCIDEADTGNSLTRRKAIYLPGWKKPELVLSSCAVAFGQRLFSDGTGKVMLEPTVAGTYWFVGRSVGTCSGSGKLVPIDLCEPEKLLVIAKLTCIGAATGANDATTLATLGKVVADLTAIAAAGATPCRIKFLAA